MTSSELLLDSNILGNTTTQLSKRTASIVDPEPELFYSSHFQVDTATRDEFSAAKDEDRQVGDCDQSRTVWYKFTRGYRLFCCNPA